MASQRTEGLGGVSAKRKTLRAVQYLGNPVRFRLAKTASPRRLRANLRHEFARWRILKCRRCSVAVIRRPSSSSPSVPRREGPSRGIYAPEMRTLPVALVFVAMFYWLWRVRTRRMAAPAR
jgi:hypothetical protein